MTKIINEETIFNAPSSFLVLPKEFISTLATATPNVTNLKFVRAGNAVITITDFIGGSDGQQLNILGDGDTTVSHNTKIKTSTAANKLLLDDVIYRFTYIDNIWYEDADVSGGASATSPFIGNYAPGSFTIADGQFGLHGTRLILTGSQRATIAGTGRLQING